MTLMVYWEQDVITLTVFEEEQLYLFRPRWYAVYCRGRLDPPAEAKCAR